MKGGGGEFHMSVWEVHQFASRVMKIRLDEMNLVNYRACGSHLTSLNGEKRAAKAKRVGQKTRFT